MENKPDDRVECKKDREANKFQGRRNERQGTREKEGKEGDKGGLA